LRYGKLIVASLFCQRPPTWRYCAGRRGLCDGDPYRWHATPVTLREKGDSGARPFKKLVAEGWLIPEEGDSLFDGGPPQCYRARSPNASSAQV
jgi:hypothetical protein